MKLLIAAVLFFALVMALVMIARRFGLLNDPAVKDGTASKERGGDDGADLCRLQGALLTPAELNFFPVLREVASQRFGVLAKVRLGDILTVPGQGSKPTTARNRIQQKHVDFLLVDPLTTRPVLVIELDDASHERQDRRERDSFLNRACAAAGVPVLHVKARHAYAPAELARAVEDKLGRAPMNAAAPR